MSENTQTQKVAKTANLTSELELRVSAPSTDKLRVAVEGCGHGTLHAIYASVEAACEAKGWNGVDLLIIGGDFQAVRNKHDLNVTAMPQKYRRMADFHEYYSGKSTATYLTIFIGGNHEASNYLFELYYGGWVAPNIYYLGAANVLRIGNLRIAGLSGIWKGYDYRKPHFERLPYNQEELTSIFHVRELDVRKLLSIRTQVDIGLSHDWPKGIEWHGDHEWLFRTKNGFEYDANHGKLGSTAAQQCLDRLRPPYWFSAHLHVKYAAIIDHSEDQDDSMREPQQLLHLQTIAEGGSDHGLPTPVSTAKPSPYPEHQTQISAWHYFHAKDRAAALAEQKQHEKDHEERRLEEQSIGKPSFRPYDFQTIFKKVTADDNLKRKVETVSEEEHHHAESPQGIPMFDGSHFSRESKRRRTDEDQPAGIVVSTPPHKAVSPERDRPAILRNPDEIEFSSSEDEESLSPDHRSYATADLRALRRAEANGASASTESHGESSAQATSGSRLSMTIREPQAVEPSVQDTSEDASKNKENVLPQASDASQSNQPASAKPAAPSETVADDLRAELAALSTNFASVPKPEVSPALPFPDAITNTITHFLALDKCEPNRDFLQLLEIGSVTTAGKPIERPVILEYDAEWLAILRVFAPELALGGNPMDKVPEHKGETHYRRRIEEEEAWVEENVVKKHGLAVPENFTVTAAVYDEEAEVDVKEMPREVTNPQTTAFCQMLGIDCVFEATEEERSARMEAGPKAESAWFAGRGAGRGGGRGGRGRGGRGRGPGGRGRGRGGRGNW